jgi:hypothetical protein
MFPGFAKIGSSRTPKARLRAVARSVEGRPFLLLALPFFGAQSAEWLLLRLTAFMADKPRTAGRHSGSTEFRRLRLAGLPVPLAAPLVCLSLALAAFAAQLSVFALALMQAAQIFKIF